MIDKILAYTKGYRIVGMTFTRGGLEGKGWKGSILKDGRVIGTAQEDGNGALAFIEIKNKEDEKELERVAVEVYPDLAEMADAVFIEYIVQYEMRVAEWKKSAKKYLIGAAGPLDERGIAMNFNHWKLGDTPENRAAIMKHYPETVFLNDSLEQFPTYKLVKKSR